VKPIPYDEIIAKANARKEALQRYDAALHDFVHHLPQLHAVIGVMRELKAAVGSLDAESRALLGAEPVYALNQWVDALLVHYDHRETRNSYRMLSPSVALVNLTGLDITL
jgi:hypothetical protein